MEVLPKRFAKHGLELHPEKTRLLDFRKPSRDASSGNNTFEFLGFSHYWAKSLKGNWVIKRKTSSKKEHKTIQELREWCRKNRHRSLEEQYRILCSKLRGHFACMDAGRAMQEQLPRSGSFQYVGIRCNLRAMKAVLYHAIRNWKFWLSRRSRKKTLNWAKFGRLLEQIPLPQPKIVHNNV